MRCVQRAASSTRYKSKSESRDRTAQRRRSNRCREFEMRMFASGVEKHVKPSSTKRSRKFFRNQPRGCPKTLTRSQMTGFNHPSDKSHTRSHQRRCTVYGESHESYAAEQSNPVWAGSKCDPHPSRRPTPRDDPPLATTHPSRRPTPRDASDATQRKRPARWLRQQSAASISASTRLRSPRYPPKHGG